MSDLSWDGSLTLQDTQTGSSISHRDGLPLGVALSGVSSPRAMGCVGLVGVASRQHRAGALLPAQGSGSLLHTFLPSWLPAAPFSACHTAVLPTLLPDYLSSGFLEQMFRLLPAWKTNRHCVVTCSPEENPSATAQPSQEVLRAAPCQEFDSRWVAGLLRSFWGCWVGEAYFKQNAIQTWAKPFNIFLTA